ncbi:hypothetical protein PC116_g19696 [Phytophthora cactorum]|uniref:Uncharacterized protein n=1 Tax=Phytophthora cactorum TaxID=29920 RepID=A0A8T1CRR4_9STRA|nr:hypothetical protein PC117_g13868 [Phytophthora cactorum]KAG4232055.1 hypothetical protein PC116_g19696 [Phytophthora cactorum]
MNRLLAEERVDAATSVVEAPIKLGSQDVEMEYVRTSDHGSFHGEYDPDHLDFSSPTRSNHSGFYGSSMIERVRISVILYLKEFKGK